MTLRIVLIALIPWQPASSAARAGSSMCVMFGVILAQTGLRAVLITQPQTSARISGFSPMAEPILRSGRPCGQEKFSSKRIDAGVLAALDDFDPGVAAVFFHDRGDENAFGVFGPCIA